MSEEENTRGGYDGFCIGHMCLSYSGALHVNIHSRLSAIEF